MINECSGLSYLIVGVVGFLMGWIFTITVNDEKKK